MYIYIPIRQQKKPATPFFSFSAPLACLSWETHAPKRAKTNNLFLLFVICCLCFAVSLRSRLRPGSACKTSLPRSWLLSRLSCLANAGPWPYSMILCLAKSGEESSKPPVPSFFFCHSPFACSHRPGWPCVCDGLPVYIYLRRMSCSVDFSLQHEHECLVPRASLVLLPWGRGWVGDGRGRRGEGGPQEPGSPFDVC